MKRLMASFPLLILGTCFIAGSMPMFVMKHPMAVFHQSFKSIPSTTEILSPSTSWIYGLLFLGIGIFFLLIWLKVLFSRHSR